MSGNTFWKAFLGRGQLALIPSAFLLVFVAFGIVVTTKTFLIGFAVLWLVLLLLIAFLAWRETK